MCKRGLWALVLAGCLPDLASENPPRAARTSVPVAYEVGAPMPSGPTGATGEPPLAENAGKQHWRVFFASNTLQGLIEEAIKNNQELNIRLQELIIAQTEVSARWNELWPKVGAGVDAGVDRVGEYTSQGVSDRLHGVPANLGNFRFGLMASWEIDVWGKLRKGWKAADARFLASIEGKNFVVTQIVAELARSYYELIALDNQIEILKNNIKLQVDALEVVKIEKLAARVTELAVQRFEAEVLKNRSRIYNLEQERAQTENRINFLVGRYPQPIARDAAELATPLPEIISAGVPAQLLENRPDVKQAGLQLQAAELDVGVAKARFFPALAIDASVGYSAFDVTHLVATPASLIGSVAGNITAPLLNRAAISAAYRAANAKQLQAVFDYERTLLQAFTDVLNQKLKYDNLQKGYLLQLEQVAVLQRSVEISTVLFRSARADYMEVLLTRRDSLDAQLELIETKLRLLQATVSIYQSLGGGWRS